MKLSASCQLGRFLGGFFSHDEIVGRFGGDEFIAFVKNTADEERACRIADEIVRGVAESVVHPDRSKKVSLSIGISLYHGEEKNYSEIFKKADTALYEAKADPENRFHVYEDEGV